LWRSVPNPTAMPSPATAKLAIASRSDVTPAGRCSEISRCRCSPPVGEALVLRAVHSGRPVDPQAAELRAERNPLKRLGKVLGPGLITGASDDDPSGIGTYAQAGAQYGFATLWTTVVMLPMMTAAQYMCAKIGLVTGRGLAGGSL